MAIILPGCQRRAYTELYIDRMATEIRELEDRIYEYDAAYRQLENEILVFQSENDTLRRRLSEAQDLKRPSPTEGLRSILPKSKAESPTPAARGSNNGPVSPPESEEKDEPDSRRERNSPSSNNRTTSPPSSSRRVDDDDDLSPPVIDLGIPGLPPSSAPSSDDVLMPPTTSPLNPSLLPINPLDRTQKIELPQAVIVAAYESSENSTGRNETNRLTSHANPPAPVDQTIIEIGFHPTLCRGQDLDNQPGDDGLYLVLQPLNQHHQMIPELGELTIVVLDPNADEESNRLGRWKWSAEELERTLEPIGPAAGMHIALTWDERTPTGDTVVVYARYVLADGKQLVNDQKVRMHRPTLGSQNWTPRSETRQP